jgi:oxygen-independent coproporphyrinogen III oxidase
MAGTVTPSGLPEAAGIYLHIPFCKQACVYCNFHFSTSLRHKTDLLAAMAKELEERKEYLGGAPVETIYFGGGTPSLLSADEIDRLVDVISRHYPVDNIREFTLEANPDDLSKEYLRQLKATPVSRLSIGIQSFRDEDLSYMKRAHNAQQADYAIKAAQDAGFTDLSIDLIYGTPGLTDTAWKQNLAKVAELSIPHFSAYALTVEERTALHYAINHKKAAPIDPDRAAAQFELLVEQANIMGFDHYEISNLGLPGHHAIHNTNYWHGRHYLGIGPAAHSFDGAGRRWNVANNSLYIKGMADKDPDFEEERLTPTQHLNEYIMTSLRTMWGCDLAKISREWDDTYSDLVAHAAQQYIDAGKMKLDESRLILTTTGKLFADAIAAELFISE